MALQPKLQRLAGDGLLQCTACSHEQQFEVYVSVMPVLAPAAFQPALPRPASAMSPPPHRPGVKPVASASTQPPKTMAKASAPDFFRPVPYDIMNIINKAAENYRPYSDLIWLLRLARSHDDRDTAVRAVENAYQALSRRPGDGNPAEVDEKKGDCVGNSDAGGHVKLPASPHAPPSSLTMSMPRSNAGPLMSSATKCSVGADSQADDLALPPPPLHRTSLPCSSKDMLTMKGCRSNKQPVQHV